MPQDYTQAERLVVEYEKLSEAIRQDGPRHSDALQDALQQLLVRRLEQVASDPEIRAVAAVETVRRYRTKLRMARQDEAPEIALVAAAIESAVSVTARQMLVEIKVLDSIHTNPTVPFQPKSTASYLHDAIVVTLFDCGFLWEIADFAAQIANAIQLIIDEIMKIAADVVADAQLPEKMRQPNWVSVDISERAIRRFVLPFFRRIRKRLSRTDEQKRSRKKTERKADESDDEHGNGPLKSLLWQRLKAAVEKILIVLGVDVMDDFLE